MDTILLRTLAWKSTIDFGKYNGMTVRNIFDLGHRRYLRWIYYNADMISFNDEILEKILIFESHRIEKPGKNPEMFEKLNRLIIAKTDDFQCLKMFKHIKKVRKKIQKSKEVKMKNQEKPIKLQAINHNKKENLK